MAVDVNLSGRKLRQNVLTCLIKSRQDTMKTPAQTSAPSPTSNNIIPGRFSEERITEEKLGKIINLAEKQDNESTDSFKITTVNAFISRLVLA